MDITGVVSFSGWLLTQPLLKISFFNNFSHISLKLFDLDPDSLVLDPRFQDEFDL
jgi:hypothetical protein